MREIAKEIIEKAADGDMDAFEEIYKAFSSMVYTLTLNITRDRRDAEEATQDVFVRIFRKLKNFRFESLFGTWVYRIAVNTALNMCRTRARRGQKAVSFDEIGETAATLSNPVTDAPEQKDAESKVAGLLDRLSPKHRSCIMLRELEGLDYKDIAEVLNVPLNTVRSRLRRAREILIAHCRKEGFHHGL